MNMKTTFIPKSHLLANFQQDLMVIFLPALASLILGQLINISTSDSFLFFAFYIIESGRLYSTFLELFFNRGSLKLKKNLYIIFISLIINIFASYVFKGNFFVFLFYLTLVHHLFMNVQILSLYQLKIPKLTNTFYLLSLVIPIILSHFRGINLGNDLTYSLRPFPIEHIIPAVYLDSIFHIGTIFFLIYLSFFYTYLFYKKDSNAILYIYHSFLYLCCFILLKNITLAMAIFVLLHGIPFYFFYQKRLSITHHSKSVKKYAYLYVALMFIIGAILEANIEDGSIYFPPHLNNIIFAMAFFPVTAHYIFNFFSWNEKNKEYTTIKNYLNR